MTAKFRISVRASKAKDNEEYRGLVWFHGERLRALAHCTGWFGDRESARQAAKDWIKRKTGAK